VNTLVVANAPLDWLPEVVLLPVHAPEARQETALVEDQVRVEDSPLAIDVGFAVSDTVGAGGMTVTVADALPVPPGPVHARVNVPVLVKAPVDWLPEVVLVPVHAPEATQEVALAEDQVRVEVAPLVTDVGLAVSDTVGAGGMTVTVADALPVPPAPVQARVNVPVLVRAPLDWLPEVVLVPVHAPEATQDVASVEDQVRVEDAPLVTDVGLAANDTVGTGAGGAPTVTVVEALPVPPAPVQASVNVPVLVNAPLDWLPKIVLGPDQAPVAKQEAELFDDQVSVEDPPLATEVGLAAIDTVGAGGGAEPAGADSGCSAPPQAANAAASTDASSSVFNRDLVRRRA